MTDLFNKLTFGVHLTATTTLTIGTGPDAPMPWMTALHSGGTEVKDYDEEEQNWPFTLAAGDYVVQLVVEDKDWFETALTITAPSAVIFVYYDASKGTVAWSASSATAPPPGNPKDPWPPPVTPYETLPTASLAWLSTHLQNARTAEVTPERGGDLLALTAR